MPRAAKRKGEVEASWRERAREEEAVNGGEKEKGRVEKEKEERRGEKKEEKEEGKETKGGR